MTAAKFGEVIHLAALVIPEGRPEKGDTGYL